MDVCCYLTGPVSGIDSSRTRDSLMPRPGYTSERNSKSCFWRLWTYRMINFLLSISTDGILISIRLLPGSVGVAWVGLTLIRLDVRQSSCLTMIGL